MLDGITDSATGKIRKTAMEAHGWTCAAAVRNIAQIVLRYETLINAGSQAVVTARGK